MRVVGLTKWLAGAALALAAAAWLPTEVSAETAAEIDAKVDEALATARKDFSKAAPLLDAAKGVLVFPKMTGGSFIVGAEYGEGALRVGGKTVDYYAAAAGSVGLQIGGGVRTDVILFMTDEALQKFQNSSGWEVGVSGNITVINMGASGALTTANYPDPILAFSFGEKGLSAGVSLEGSKYTKIVR
jgi:lipid-binding SYLF domain-containing protein